MDLLKPRDRYNGSDYYGDLIQQWAKCVEMANSTSDKRISTNNLFITIDAALLTVLQFTTGWRDYLVSFVGIVLSFLWISIIKKYKALNALKYEIILEMEKVLPARPFKVEYDNYYCNKDSSLSRLELFMPRFFICFFIAMVILDYFFPPEASIFQMLLDALRKK